MNQESQLFNFLRGALRGHFGVEDLRPHTFLFKKMTPDAQQVLTRLCIDGVSIYFTDPSVCRFYQTHVICGLVKIYAGEDIDVLLDFDNEIITVGSKSFPMNKISGDAYTQGIHEFYGVKVKRADASNNFSCVDPSKKDGVYNRTI